MNQPSLNPKGDLRSLQLAHNARDVSMPYISIPGCASYSCAYDLSNTDESAALNWAKQQPSIGYQQALGAIKEVVGESRLKEIE